MSVKSTEEFHVSSLLRGVAHGWALLTKAERKRMRLLWVMIVVDGMFKTFALAAIVPFVLIVVDPDRFFSHPRLKQVIEWLGVGEPTELLVVAGILLIGVIFLKNAFGWVTMRTTFYFSASCEARLSEEMMGRVLHAPFAWTIQHNSQRLRIIIKDHVRNWAGPFQRSMVRIVNDLVFTVTMMAVLIYASPGAGAIVSILAIVMSLLIICGIRPVMLRLAETIRVTRIEATILGAQAISGVKDIKMTGTEDYFLHAFTKKVKRSADTASRAMLWQQIPRIIIETLSYGALISLIVIALSSGISPNELAAVGSLYAVAALRLMPTISNVVSSFGAILAILPSIEEIRRLLSETKKTRAPESSEDGQFNAWREFTVSELGYTYATGKQSALYNINLEIEFGKTYGLAGRSGSGKSTLIDIVSGVLEPEHGTIEIDGRPLNNESLRSWRRHTGYVTQSPFMLDGTLRENIAFGLYKKEVDEERLEEVIKLSNLTEVVANLPEGLDTQIGEQAMRLSGGERQRVAIARALYQDVRLLIFDEATSALDNLSEREIRNTITEIANKVTIILIAHRMSTIVGCDKIFVLDQGRLVGEGGYDELLTNCPAFVTIVEAAPRVESAATSLASD
jgi:ABC-type multidrug transport system fused ATPase/permease subunit